jgi:hypothetical protein
MQRAQLEPEAKAAKKRLADPTYEPAEGGETEAALTALLSAKIAGVRVAPFVELVLAATRGGTWRLRRAAAEALLRRFPNGESAPVAIETRPSKGLLGDYVVGRKDGGTRYALRISSAGPFVASCGCADFLRNGLGACKHAAAAAMSSPLVFNAAATDAALKKPSRPAVPPIRLTWDPVKPLTGSGDRLARLRLATAGARLARAVRAAGAADGAEAGKDGALRPTAATCADAAKRRAFVRRWLSLVENAGDSGLAAALDAEPAAVAVLRAELAALGDAEAATTAELTRALRGLKRPIFPYQRESVRRLIARGRLLLADDMGLGKTAQAVACCHALHALGRVRRGLVVAPASLKDQWRREWSLFTDLPVRVVDGDAAARAAIYAETREGFLIANYEQLWTDGDAVRAFAPDLAVVDEGQRIKNWATKTAAAVKSLAPRYRLLLTGTPMENRLGELASVAEWIDDDALEPKWRLQPWHTASLDGGGGGGAVRLDVLRDRLAPCLLRRTRAEVLGELPPRTDVRVPLAMTPEQREAHDDYILPIAQLLRIAKTRPLAPAQFQRLMMMLTQQRMIANGMAQAEFVERWPELSRVRAPSDAYLTTLASPKLGELRTLIAELAVRQKRKVVVFSQWRRALLLAAWAARPVLAAAGLRAAFFTGAESRPQRERNVTDFHDDPATAVMFLTDAGGVGLNLQRAASACVQFEAPWNPAVQEQRIARIHRMGQTRPIDVYHLVSEDSIEARIVQTVGDKLALFKGLFDGSTEEVRFERAQSFLARVERLVADGAAPAAPTEAVPRSDAAEESDDAERLDEPSPEAASGVGAGDEIPAAAATLELATPAASQAAVSTDAAAYPSSAPHVSQVAEASSPAALFARLRVERTATGGLRIEAPPDAARALADLFGGFATLLRDAADA